MQPITFKRNSSLELSYKDNHVFVNSVANNSASLEVVRASNKVANIELSQGEIDWLNSEEVNAWLKSVGYCAP